MLHFDINKINKPAFMSECGLLAHIGIYDAPITARDTLEPSYRKTCLAMNEKTGLLLVYISADTEEGLEEFRMDYPDANMTQNIIEDPDQWEQLAFPDSQVKDGTPLDIYYQGRAKENIR